MNEIVIDIETVPGKLGPEVMEIANQRCAKKRGDNKDIYRYCSLNPEFGQICCLGIGIGEKIATLAGMSENDILEGFWTLMREKTRETKDTRFVTFNGKGFDIPFIIKRSAFLGIPPTIKISTRRYDTQFHFDCLEVLSNYFQGELFSLKHYCSMFGIENHDDTDGGDIYSLWLKGDKAAIEKHCAADVQATLALYQKIRGYY